MPIPAHILQQGIELYLSIAYPGNTVPAAAAGRAQPIKALPPSADVPPELLETDAANSLPSYALRLGQPAYPHMKLVVEPAPGNATPTTYLLRVDAHDRHLHAPAGSPDAAWLSSIRTSNKDLSERIEAAWSAAHLPTFKDFLRQQLLGRKAAIAPPGNDPVL